MPRVLLVTDIRMQMNLTYRDRTAWTFPLTTACCWQQFCPLRIGVYITIMLRDIEDRICALDGRGERDVDRFGSGMEVLLMPSNCNLVKKFISIERNPSHDVGTTLAFALLLRRGDLVDVSDESGDTQTNDERKYHTDDARCLLWLICAI